ncbi:hypothetical protein PAPHI01_0407 [Pancytospora philotis]|nr:hypothetical protein PAPHI01_0407 [Pancytospora philotis]
MHALSAMINFVSMVMLAGAVVVSEDGSKVNYRKLNEEKDLTLPQLIDWDAKYSPDLHVYQKNNACLKLQFIDHVKEQLGALYAGDGDNKARDNFEQLKDVLLHIYDLAFASSKATSFELAAFTTLVMCNYNNFSKRVDFEVKNNEDDGPRGMLGLFANSDFRNHTALGRCPLDKAQIGGLMQDESSWLSIRVEFEIFRRKVINTISGSVSFEKVLELVGSTEERTALADFANGRDASEESISEAVHHSLSWKYFLFYRLAYCYYPKKK